MQMLKTSGCLYTLGQNKISILTATGTGKTGAKSIDQYIKSKL